MNRIGSVPPNVVAGIHPRSIIDIFPEIASRCLRPCFSSRSVRDTHDLRVFRISCWPLIARRSIRVLVSCEISPPSLHLIWNVRSWSKVWIKQVIQLTRMSDQSIRFVRIMSGKFKDIHILLGLTKWSTVEKFVDRTRVKWSGRDVVCCHESCTRFTLSIEVIHIEVLQAFCFKARVSESVPVGVILILGHRVTSCGIVVIDHICAIIFTPSKNSRYFTT